MSPLSRLQTPRPRHGSPWPRHGSEPVTPPAPSCGPPSLVATAQLDFAFESRHEATNYTVAVLDDVRIPLTRYLVFDKEGRVLDEEGRVQWCTHFKTILFKSIVEMRPDQLVTNNKLLGISVGYFCSNKR